MRKFLLRVAFLTLPIIGFGQIAQLKQEEQSLKVKFSNRKIKANDTTLNGKKVSKTAQASKSSLATYCTVSLDCTDGDVITNVTFAGINNNSSCGTNGYSDYSTMTPGQLLGGQSYPLSVTVGDGWYERVSAWIDYNNDGTFDTSEYLGEIGNGGTGVTVTDNITIPANVDTGNYRLRIQVLAAGSNNPASTDPCTNDPEIYGEYEDYTVVITKPAACTGAPTVDSVSSSLSSICTGQSFVLSATATPSSAYSYQWQSSTDNNTWSNLGSSQGISSYTVTSQAVSTYYRIIVTCTETSQSTTSNAITVTQNAPTQCYCSAGATSTSFEKISNVTFANINQSSSSTAGYEDFTSVVGNTTAGSNYSLTVTGNSSSYANDQVIVWVDLNQDGDFNDAGEQVYTSAVKTTPWTGTITIPATATIGTTRMRVRLHDTAFGGNSASCGTSTYGQVEDYTLNIGQLAVSETAKTNIKSYPNPVKDIFNIEAQGKIKSVKVYDATGKQLLTKDLNDAKSQIDFSRFGAGTYVVTTLLEDGTSTSTKVIKK